MRQYEFSVKEFTELLATSPGIEDLVDVDGTVAVVRLDDDADVPVDHRLIERVAVLPMVLVGVRAGADGTDPRAVPFAPYCDVIISEDPSTLEPIIESVAIAPRAATALAMLLRASEHRSIGDGLVAESAVYSMLQGGPEFAAWRRSRPVRQRFEAGPAVRISRSGNTLELVLDRPQVRNALNVAMRDELYEALTMAAAEPDVHVHLRGEGATFCAGGDLDEFGSFPDPATAHLIRLARSIGHLIAGISERVTAHVHGACMGSGIELPAFAGRVVAREGATFGLPEVRLGLIPGAGGTVSITRRIGRHRTAYLALSAQQIDAVLAYQWQLVDEIVSQ